LNIRKARRDEKTEEVVEGESQMRIKEGGTYRSSRDKGKRGGNGGISNKWESERRKTCCGA